VQESRSKNSRIKKARIKNQEGKIGVDMAKKRLPGNVGSGLKEVIAEELDPEGLPVIEQELEVPEVDDILEMARPLLEKRAAVRITGDNIKLVHPGKGQVRHRRGDVIEHPWPGLLHEAKADRQNRKFKIIHL